MGITGRNGKIASSIREYSCGEYPSRGGITRGIIDTNKSSREYSWGSKQEFDGFRGSNSIAYRGGIESSERELREFAGILKGCYGE